MLITVFMSNSSLTACSYTFNGDTYTVADGDTSVIPFCLGTLLCTNGGLSYIVDPGRH